MKILHIVSGSLSNGAGKGALRLHQGLLNIGVDSHLATSDLSFPEDVANIISDNIFKNFVYKNINQIFNFMKQMALCHSKDELFSFSTNPFECFSKIDISDYDIIHLHWVNYSLGIDQVRKLAENHKVVWTLRDMWPLTGGCHYSLSCTQYDDGCGHCPMLKKSSKQDTSALMFSSKEVAFKDINFVGISDWMSTVADSSSITNKKHIHRIYNSVDSSIFNSDMDKVVIKKKYSINTSKSILITGAKDVNKSYKGPKQIREFMQLHADKYFFLIFGSNAEALCDGISNLEYIDFGFVDETALAELFCVSDAFLMLSQQEAFGKTIVEALFCGTPVIVSPGSAPEELITLLGDKCGFVWNGVDFISNNIDILIQNALQIPIRKLHEMFSLESIALEYNEYYSGL